MNKHLTLLAAALLLTFSVYAQADKAKYYIEGQLATPTKTGQPWKLYNIRSQGITFTDSDTIYGHDTDKGVQLVFDHAATTHPQGFNCGLKFYRWQNNSGRWQVDSEVENAEAAFTQQKVMSIMLVLDCSSSIGDADFVKLKNAAKQFIDVIIDKSSDGNVHIGIVGFNSMKNTRTFDLRPLTKESKRDMFQFIDTLQLNNRTAFYYAINKGLDNIKQYVGKLKVSKEKKYDGNYIIAFTDGYDNDSFDPKIGKAAEGTEHRYFQHVNQRIMQEKIGGAPIESYVLAIRGNDVDRTNTDFEREGTSVLYELPISIVQASLGAEMEVPTLDGKVKYTVPEGTQSGTVFRLKGKGIPYLRGGGRGDEFVTVKVVTPKNLNREQKELLQKLGESFGDAGIPKKKGLFGKL